MVLLRSLEDLNFPLREVDLFRQHAIGRWDVLLKNKKLIKLPKKNFRESIQKYVKIHNDPNFEKILSFRLQNKRSINFELNGNNK